ncbi:siroheme synthase CysG [Pokkaliibacter sp. CJK22405]|uniref:siroheme synthase CysG n=1 Tax=Pokkaliibacter sp. CJK22405 TaxID=3384615 RepID=UPI003984C6D0
MKSLPLFFISENRHALVIGGGKEAEPKIRQLLDAGCRVHALAEVFSAEVSRMLEEAEQGSLEYRQWRPDDLAHCDLLVVADVDDDEAITLSSLAQTRHLPVNVVDKPSLCTLTFPARVRRGDVQLALGTAGKATLLATILREEFEQRLPQGLGWLAESLSRYKPEWHAALPKGAPRREWLRGVWQEAQLALPATEAEVDTWLAERLPGKQQRQGQVVLVGAGPGDPELLTIKALRALQQADVIVYDRLVSAEIIAMARADAERVFVGKNKGFHSLPQDEINQLLVREAKAGRYVVRLKGGDPFIFGRGGEEMEELMEAGISCQVIPGITSASGCSAYSGIPLTHRDHAQSVTFVTGHLQQDQLILPWESLAKPQQTLVFYMGLTALSVIIAGLVGQGVSAEMPVALIHKGTCPEQQVLVSTLGEVEKDLEVAGLTSPTLIIVGNVVRCSVHWQAR